MNNLEAILALKTKLVEDFKIAIIQNNFQMLNELFQIFNTHKNIFIENSIFLEKYELIQLATQHHSLDMVKKLVEHGINPNYYASDSLIYAIKHSQFPIAQYLVDKGAELDYIDCLKFTQYNVDLIRFLLNNGMDIHYNNDELLRLNVENGRLENVKYLVEEGANINVVNQKFEIMDSLTLISLNKNYSMMKYLIEQHCEFDCDNYNALNLLVLQPSEESVELLQFLIENNFINEELKNKLLVKAFSKPNSKDLNCVQHYLFDSYENEQYAFSLVVDCPSYNSIQQIKKILFYKELNQTIPAILNNGIRFKM